jgi:hypothetical protein
MGLGTASWAEQLTVVIPTWKTLPEAGEQVVWTVPDTASVALAVYVTVAWFPGPAVTVMFAGTVNAGGVVSWTLIVNDEDPGVPRLSVAVQVTVVVVPSANIEPDTGAQFG